MGLIQEFRDFAVRGNVVDMAVGVIIGGAFGKIVSSVVGDIVMPTVGTLTGTGSLGSQFLWFGSGEKPTLDVARTSGEPFIAWGAFAQTTLDFLIIALAVFLMIKVMNNAQKRFLAQPQAQEALPPPEDVQLLREIRDALKKG